MIIGPRKQRFKLADQLAKPLLILSTKPRIRGAVDVKNANDLPIYDKRQHNFSVAGGIAGDVAIEGVNVIDALHLAAGGGGTAHAAPDGNAHAGNFALERPQYQRIPFEQIKPRPVDVAQTFVEQRAGIRECGLKTGFTCH